MTSLESSDVVRGSLLAQAEKGEEHEGVNRYSVEADHEIGVNGWRKRLFWNLRDDGKPCVNRIPTLVFGKLELIEVGEDYTK